MWLTAGFFDESTDEDTVRTSYAVAGFIGAQLITAKLEVALARPPRQIRARIFQSV
jgi:hypothetical protein